MSILSGTVRLVISLVMIAVVLVAGFFIYTVVSGALGPEKPKTAREPVMFTISPGESVSTISENLKSAGVIDNSFWFRVRLKLRGVESQIKAGRFQLTPGTETDAVIDALTSTAAEHGVKFTVIEGLRLEEVAERLAAQGIVSPTAFMRLVTTPEGQAKLQDDFLTSAGKPGDRSLEGYLFPDTYEIKQGEGDNSEAVVNIMLKTLEEKLTPEMRTAVSEKGRTIHEALTVASIVQREGIVKEELPTIASVYWNRLRRDMLLNADPATQYAVGQPGKWWPELTLDQLHIESPYNTYNVHGLPPAPICGAGLAAITAAVYPEETDYLYFVAKNDGSKTHAFARTLEEHERNRVTYGNR